MKRIILTILLFTCSLANAQIKEVSEAELYEKAEANIEEYAEKNFEADSAKFRLKAYESYSLLVSKFPKSGKISYYLYTKGTLAYDKKERKNCFEEVTQINSWKYYVRKSYINLCFYAIEEKDFYSAKQYLEAIEKMEKPTFTCGNEMETYQAQLKNLYARCEAGSKK